MSDECYEWQFLQKYDFTDRGLIIVNLNIDRTVCKNNEGKFVDNNEDSLLWVSIVSIILSLISFIATWLYFYGMSEHLNKLQQLYDRRLEENLNLQSDVKDSNYDLDLVNKYKATEISNQRFKRQQSGIQPDA